MTALTALGSLTAKIAANLRAADEARNLPFVRVRAVQAIRMEPPRMVGELTAAQQIIADRMRAAAVEEERAAGVVARDRELKRLAAELDGLRRQLPAAAVAAQFALLDDVRAMRESRHG